MKRVIQTLHAHVWPNLVMKDAKDTPFQAMESMPEASFEELFNNLNQLKSKAEKLPPSERKAYAEKVAISFWRSFAGDDSEIEGLSSDEET